jgi:hypothetical protein
MSVSRRWTSADLEELEKKEFERYEIIGGELLVTSAPSWQHQYVSSSVWAALTTWGGEAPVGL